MRAALAWFDNAGDRSVRGYAYFEQAGAHEPTRVWVRIDGGLTRGREHAFHIHEYGDARRGCASMGGHFNPYHKPHGSWVYDNDDERHVGDLLNNLPPADARGATRVRFWDTLVTLFGAHSVYGCSLVVHVGTDDLGRGGTPESRVTGNAGARLACAPIVRCAPDASLKFDPRH